VTTLLEALTAEPAARAHDPHRAMTVTPLAELPVGMDAW
jgi:hypothetical protein